MGASALAGAARAALGVGGGGGGEAGGGGSSSERPTRLRFSRATLSKDAQGRVQEEATWTLVVFHDSSFALSHALAVRSPSEAGASMEVVEEITYFGAAGGAQLVSDSGADAGAPASSAFDALLRLHQAELERRAAAARGEFCLKTLATVRLAFQTQRVEVKRRRPRLVASPSSSAALLLWEWAPGFLVDDPLDGAHRTLPPAVLDLTLELLGRDEVARLAPWRPVAEAPPAAAAAAAAAAASSAQDSETAPPPPPSPHPAPAARSPTDPDALTGPGALRFGAEIVSSQPFLRLAIAPLVLVKERAPAAADDAAAAAAAPASSLPLRFARATVLELHRDLR